jgi:hypothetical protein
VREEEPPAAMTKSQGGPVPWQRISIMKCGVHSNDSMPDPQQRAGQAQTRHIVRRVIEMHTFPTAASRTHGDLAARCFQYSYCRACSRRGRLCAPPWCRACPWREQARRRRCRARLVRRRRLRTSLRDGVVRPAGLRIEWTPRLHRVYWVDVLGPTLPGDGPDRAAAVTKGDDPVAEIWPDRHRGHALEGCEDGG